MKYYGKVHSDRPSRRFGFIRRPNGESDVFFHYDDTPGRSGIMIGVEVEFEMGKDSKGRPLAINVVPLPWREESPAPVQAGGQRVEV